MLYSDGSDNLDNFDNNKYWLLTGIEIECEGTLTCGPSLSNCHGSVVLGRGWCNNFVKASASRKSKTGVFSLRSW